MLTSIFRFSPVLQVAVGPRFDALQPYNRPGFSTRILAVPKQQHLTQMYMEAAHSFVQAKSQVVYGEAVVAAKLSVPIETYEQRPRQATIAIATAMLVGIPPKRNFGSVE